MTKLRSLDLSFNRISVLPDSIGNFTNLRTLSLNNNKLGMLPPKSSVCAPSVARGSGDTAIPYSFLATLWSS